MVESEDRWEQDQLRDNFSKWGRACRNQKKVTTTKNEEKI